MSAADKTTLDTSPEFKALLRVAAPARGTLRAIETDKSRRQRYAARLIMKGYTFREVTLALQDKFGVCTLIANRDINTVLERAKLLNDDAGRMDVVVSELVKNALKRAEMFHAETVAPLPDTPFSPADLRMIARQRIESDKAARANAEFVLEIFGRTSAKWSRKTQIDVSPLQGGTDEQRAAVNRLLGIDTPQIVDTTAIPVTEDEDDEDA